ncbi:hypothetical protein HAX54_039937 [Datura stramonium]|uniref:Uncharacterized protein n=1 Tax=Datura stramonium TaxID=4076 RepID=A0ABS8VM13_DATST|nr:hypothetical protein [Datura stramonium]
MLWSKSCKPYRLTWFNTQKEAKYAPENRIDEGRLALEFPTIRDKLNELGVGYIFAEPKECKLTLVRDFYTNWDISFEESSKVKIRGQVARFTYKRFNAILGTPTVDPSKYFILLERAPYRDIFPSLCGHLTRKMIDVTKVKETVTSIAQALTIADHQARDKKLERSCIWDLDIDDDEDDATTGTMQVDGDDDENEDQDYNPDDDALWPRKFLFSYLLI